MAKIQVLDINGNKSKEISTNVFDGQIRKDIVQKIVEIERLAERQMYSPFYLAGLQTSASGNVHHNRHVWKTDRGRGLSRYPKKRMSDKGSNFVWVAAVVPGVRGGRRSHPPEVIRAESKINKKEKIMGLLSALAMTCSAEELNKKYSTLEDIKLKLPLIVDSKITSLKTREIFNALNKILGKDVMNIALQNKTIRAGRGKMRGRKYKKNSGMLLVLANSQKIKINGIDVKKVEDLKLKDLASNGARLVVFTEEAISDIEKKISGAKK